MKPVLSFLRRRALLFLSTALVFGGAFPRPLTAQERENEAKERLERIWQREKAFVERYGMPRPALFKRAAVIGSKEKQLERRRAQRSPLAVGPTWVSLGPSYTPQGNFAGAFPGQSDSGLVNAIAIHPTDPKTLFIGPAGGGVWRTTDGGGSWKALTDDIGLTEIGAIAIAPSDPNRIYAGGGSGRQSIGIPQPGPGLLVSADGGGTWRVTASSPGGEFWFIRIDPQNARTLLVGTDKGLSRSTDGGETWTKTLGAPGDPWATALAASPSNPSVLLATTFHSGLESLQNGACVAVSGFSPAVAGKLWKSTDAGLTWTENLNLPGSDPAVRRSRIELAVAPSSPLVVYALIAKTSVDGNACASGVLGDLLDVAKSTDGGETWTALKVASTFLKNLANDQMDYAAVISVDPRDPNTVFVGGLDTFKSTDGGASWRQISRWVSVEDGDGGFLHADQHFHAWAPDGSIVYFGNDGGIFSSTDGGQTFKDLNKGLVTFQFYSVCQTPAAPDQVAGGAQDNGTSLRAPSGAWTQVIGGDGLACAMHPTNPAIIVGTVQDNRYFRTTNGGSTFFSSQIRVTGSSGDATVSFTKLKPDPSNPDHFYTVTSLRLWDSTDGGLSWLPKGANIPGTASIHDFDFFPPDPKRMLLGIDGGAVLISTNGGTTFTPVGATPVRGIGAVRFDRTDANRLFVTIVRTDPGIEHVFASSDGGATWTGISHTGQPNGLPDLPVDELEQDPKDPNVLWIVNTVGVYRSPDRGATWQRWGQGLPNVWTKAISILPDGSKIRVATFGRGMWETSAAALPPDSPPTAVIDVPSTTPTLDAGLPASFHGVAADPDPGDVLTTRWDFGDGTPAATGVAVVHAFAVPGTYTVMFTVTDLAGLSATATRAVNVRIPEGSAASGAELLLPVVLDVFGASNTHYTTEVTLVSRAAAPSTVLLQYTASNGAGSGYASVTLQPGEVRLIPDAIAFLKSQGLPIPDGSVGTLRAIFGGANPADVFIGGRTSTPGAGGAFGLFYSSALTSTTSATVFGLQQNAAQRANLALVNAGPSPITLRVQLVGGSGEDLGTLPDISLDAYGWMQLNRVLEGKATSGRAVVTRISGSSPFTIYGVLNDAVTSDGSYIPPVIPGDSTGADRLVPIVLNAGGLAHYQTELTITNLTSSPMIVTLVYTAAIGSGSGQATITLAAGEQRILADAIPSLRGYGIPIPAGGDAGGSLLIKAPSGTPASSLAAGARTFTMGSGGGTFGLFYPGLTLGECATAQATINGLQQNAPMRSNLAIVNRGDAGDSITLRLTYHGPDGAVLGSPVMVTLAPGEWKQYNQPLGALGAEAGWVKIERISGNSRWASYGVLNDNANSDGSYLPMSR